MHNGKPKAFRLTSAALAAISFGAFGLVVSCLMFLVPASKAGPVEIGLYIAIPTLSAALAGFLRGTALLDLQIVSNYLQALLHGILVSLLALVIHSVLFTMLYAATTTGEVHTLAFVVAAFGIGVIATGPVIFVAGALCALLLHQMAKNRSN